MIKKRIQHMLIILTLVMISVITSGCNSIKNVGAVEDVNHDENKEKLEALIDNYDLDDAFKMIVDHFGEDAVSNYIYDNLNFGAIDFGDIIEKKYYGSWYEFFENKSLPDSVAIIDELLCYGYYDDIEYLKKIAKKIDHEYSEIFGLYIADNNKVIHWTDGPCFEKTPVKDLIPIGPFSEYKYMEKFAKEYGYSICPVCFKD